MLLPYKEEGQPLRNMTPLVLRRILLFSSKVQPACPGEMHTLQSVRFRLLWIVYKPWDFSLQQIPVRLQNEMRKGAFLLGPKIWVLESIKRQWKLKAISILWTSEIFFAKKILFWMPCDHNTCSTQNCVSALGWKNLSGYCYPAWH